jgi:hypothetical protein
MVLVLIATVKNVIVCAEVISLPTVRVGDASLRIHYNRTHESACRSTLILVGVGTAMTETNYDGLGSSIAGQLANAIVVIVNPNRSPIKLNALPFADALSRAVSRLQESERVMDVPLLPAEAKLCPQNLQTVVGGHSASGAAAFYALNDLYNFSVSGYIGLDPFPIKQQVSRTVPTLTWGFSATTCQVTASQAAMAAYERALPNYRVLYQLNNTIHPESSSCRFSHCLFTDDGCPFCGNQCNATTNRNAIADVALSLRLFVQALQSTLPFSKSTFDSPSFRLERTLYGIYPFDNITSAKVIADHQEL